jgi:DtxR family transcriptional regulator, Mn-dependent transcriptional regulator
MTAKRHLTVSVEDYLKAIYSLTQDGTAASTSSLAEALAVQPASVTGMIKRLAESGYAEHLPYKGVWLTESGAREALRIVRRHRVLETYLQLRLGFSWDDVHREAERLEHAASDALIDRMAAALEDPSHDPHGAPIPTKRGEVEAPAIATLADASTGSTVEIQAVQDEDSERLRYMEALGLTPGVRVQVRDRAPFDGPLTIAVGGERGADEAISHDLARRIFVAPPSDGAAE